MGTPDDFINTNSITYTAVKQKDTTCDGCAAKSSFKLCSSFPGSCVTDEIIWKSTGLFANHKEKKLSDEEILKSILGTLDRLDKQKRALEIRIKHDKFTKFLKGEK